MYNHSYIPHVARKKSQNELQLGSRCTYVDILIPKNESALQEHILTPRETDNEFKIAPFRLVIVLLIRCVSLAVVMVPIMIMPVEFSGARPCLDCPCCSLHCHDCACPCPRRACP